MNIFSIFTLLSLFYVYQAFRLGQTIWGDWANFKKNPMTQLQKQRANRAAFFIVVPFSVAIHELAHALAIWLFGGQVVGGGFFFFWGYVVPSGTFSPFENWFISLAGTIGSLLVGLSVWLYYRGSSSNTLHYFGVRAVREQIILSLIYYPVFTAVSQIGDWRSIYDFAATPLWSSITAVFHTIILIGYFLMERQGRFDQLAFRTMAEKDKYDQLQTALKNGLDPKLQLQEIALLRENGLRRLAGNKLSGFIKQYPNNGDAYYELVLLQINTQQKAVPAIAYNNIQKAMALGISSKNKQVFAYRVIGQYHLDRGELETAIEQYGLGLKFFDLTQLNAFSSQEKSILASLFHARSLALKELSQFERAHQDIHQAIDLAMLNGNKTAVQQFEETRASINQAQQATIRS
ncbi:MAG: hypothetical protein AAF490_19970 [Chloroflexota bacterium]